MNIPGIGKILALPVQDLPVEHVATWMAAPDDMKPLIGWKLFGLAAGAGVDLSSISYGEASSVLLEWQDQSLMLETLRKAEKRGKVADEDTLVTRTGVDWEGLLE